MTGLGGGGRVTGLGGGGRGDGGRGAGGRGEGGGGERTTTAGEGGGLAVGGGGELTIAAGEGGGLAMGCVTVHATFSGQSQYMNLSLKRSCAPVADLGHWR